MSTDQNAHTAVELLRTEPDRFRRQGAIVPSWRNYRGRRLGTCCRLAWRENGRQRSICLGRQGPVVDQARLLLREIQFPHREELALLKNFQSVDQNRPHHHRTAEPSGTRGPPPRHSLTTTASLAVSPKTEPGIL